MNTVSISFSTSKVFNAYDAVAVRFAYIIGDHVLFAGDAHMGVFAEHYFGVKHDTTKNKIQYLMVFAEKHPETGASVVELQEILVTWQMMCNQKHKTPKQIVAQKQIEKLIDKAYQDTVKPAIQAFEISGMSQLATLEDEVMELGIIEPDDPEVKQESRNTKVMAKLSEVLHNKFTGKNADDIYLVTLEFGDFIKNMKLKTGSFSEKINAQAQVISIPLFRLPSITHFKSSELQTIRKCIQGINEDFRKNMKQWSIALNNTAFEPVNFATIYQYFESKIAPQINSVQTALDADELLRQSDVANHQTLELSITLHVCPVGLYYQYLGTVDSLKPETLNALTALPDFEKNAQTSCILLECAMRNVEQTKQKETVAEEPVLTKRKTLDID